MATIQGITVAKATEIENNSIVSGQINTANGHLLLSTAGGKQIDAGLVVANSAASWPVGSVFMTVRPENPSELLGGGTWARWGKGRVPVSIDETSTEFNSIEQLGGTKKHKLSVGELPIHSHGGNTGGRSADHFHGGNTDNAGSHNHDSAWYPTNIQAGGGTSYSRGGAGYGGVVTSTNGDHNHHFTTGGESVDHTHTIPSEGQGLEHNNLQPYIAVFMWKRTA